MVDKVAFAELVLDELVGGAGVGHPEQGLRQHHQREALLGRERELAQHVLDAAERVLIVSDRLDQPRRDPIDALLPLGRETGARQKLCRNGAILGRKRCAERRNRHRIRFHGTPSTVIPRAPYHAAGL